MSGAAGFGMGVAAAAFAGGFVGSVASQLVGKAMGAVDSFSLRKAVAGGLTSIATAGIGAGLREFASLTEVTKTGTELSKAGKIWQAGLSVPANVGTNQLAGIDTSFSWGNVAVSVLSTAAMTSDVMSGVMDKISLAASDAASFDWGNTINATTTGIVGAGVSYGLGKALLKGADAPSWNFRQVAMSAFGNAVGSEINRSQEKVGFAKVERQRSNDEQMARVHQSVSRKANEAVDAQVKASMATAQEKRTQELSANADSKVAAMNDVIAANNDASLEAMQSKRLSIAEQANAISASYAEKRDELQARFDTQISGIKTRVVDSKFNSKTDGDILSMSSTTTTSSIENTDSFGEFLPSTRENPFGLHDDRRSYVDFYAKNLRSSIADGFSFDDLNFYEQQHYEMARDQHVESLSGPQLIPANPNFEASQRQLAAKQKAFFTGQRWEQRVAQGINDSAMLAAFRYHPGKLMAAQAGYSLGNFDKPWVASGLNDLYGADIRLSVGLKNEQMQFEAKIYSGTDSDINASWKSGRIQFDQNGLKGNVSQHYQLKNIFDLNSFQVVNVGEVEMANAIKLQGFNVGKYPVKSSLTPGVRVNLDNLNVRGSFNYKFELPKHYQVLDWTPSVGVEIRK